MAAVEPEAGVPPALASADLPERPTERRRPNPFRRLYRWVLHWADTPYGTPALATLSFLESSVFPVPPDVLQIALSVSKPRRSFHYAAVSAAASVAGAVLGWVIGAVLWSSVSGVLFASVPGLTPEAFAQVRVLYNQNAFLAILTAAVTPIPFKVFTIASGVFGVSLATLVLAALLGRSGRFFAVGACIFAFGPPVTRLIERYFELAMAVLLVLAIAGFFAIRLCF